MKLSPADIATALANGGSLSKSVAETLAGKPLAAPPPAPERQPRIKPTLRGERQLSVSLTLPWPPTTNTLFVNAGNRGRVPTKKALAYREEVAAICLEQRIGHVVGRHLRCEVWAYPPDNRRRDLDNLWKAVLDSLQAAGVFEDDSQFSTLTIHRGEVGAGALSVTIHGSTPAEEAAGWRVNQENSR